MAGRRDQDKGQHDGVVSSLKRAWPLALIVAAMVLVFTMGWHRYLTLEQLALHRDMLQQAVTDYGWMAFAGFLLLYAIVVILSLPVGGPLTIVGGFLFGSVLAGTGIVVIATLSAAILFLIVRTSLGEPLAARAGPWLGKLRDGFQRDAFNYLLFLRLVPVFPFWLVNLAPALLGVPLRLFVIGTFIGIIPGTFAFAFLGAGLDSVIVAQREAHAACLAEKGTEEACPFALEISALVTPQLLIALGALGVVALIPVMIKRFKASRT